MPPPAGFLRPARAHIRELAFVLKVLPMLPSGLVDRLTPAPRIERIRYPSSAGEVTADLYRPPGPGPHPAQVLCLGVVPFGVEHPQVPRLGEALARAGIVALIHWSDAMRDRRLAAEDVLNIALAYDALLKRDDVDPARSGLLGTCVGGSFALLAAAHPLIRDRVRYAGAFAPYSSMWTFARDIASASRDTGGRTAPWAVDPITREVYERTIRSLVAPDEADRLLSVRDPEQADAALRALPDTARAALDAMSPVLHIGDIRAGEIVLGHDRDDEVIPIAETRRLAAALAGRPGVRFTEYGMFQHADPTQRRLPPITFAREVARFYGSLHPIFRVTA